MTTTVERRAPIRFRVAGVTFHPNYPANLHQLREPAEHAWTTGEGLPVILIRDPHNPHDPNAIQIHTPTAGMVGHMPRHLATRCAPHMDAGQRFAGEVIRIAVDPDHPDKPGIEIRVWRHHDEAVAS